MKRWWVLGTALILPILLATLVSAPPQAALAQAAVYEEDFEGGTAGDWQLDYGWQIQDDGGNHVLAGQGHTWARLPLYIDGDTQEKFRLKLISGRIHVNVRLTSGSRYFIGIEPGRTDLNKQYFPNDFREGMDSGGSGVAFNRWYDIEVVIRGSTITLNIDGTKQWSYTDPEPLSGGSLAFETLEGALAHIDDVSVSGPTESAPPSSAPGSAPTGSASGSSGATSSTDLAWVRLGGPLGGLGYDVRMRPDNPDVMYVTDAWAGLFMSTDGGASWFPSSEGITTRTGHTGEAIPVFSATIDPNNPEIVWAGTQFQRGIFKSTDAGRTWKKMDNGIVEGDGITFRGFTPQPGNSEIVYAAAEISSWAGGRPARTGRSFDMTRGVVYKTTNGGSSWQAVWRGDNLARYIWINPQNTDVVYISTGFFDREAANSDPNDPDRNTPGGEGILKSEDAGKTWKAANNGLGNLYVTSLFMHPTNPEVLLAGTGSNEYYQGAGVYLTTDGGASWTCTLNTAPYTVDSVEFATSDPTIAYAGNDAAIYRSEDGGHVWSRVSGAGNWGPPGVAAGFPIDFMVDPRNPDRLFANEYGGGNFVSTDGGATWTDASRGYTGALMRGLAVHPTSPSVVYAVARSGLFGSRDGGLTWHGLGVEPLRGNDWTALALDPKDPQHLLANSGWAGLGLSMDSGRSWQVVRNATEDRTDVRALAFSPSDPTTVYLGIGGYFNVGVWQSDVPGKGVEVSHDGGKTWLRAASGPAADANVAALVVDPSDPKAVFAATSNRGLLRSSDGGQTWEQISGGLTTTRAILSLALAPDNPAVMLAGIERGGAYRSTDGGKTWQRATSGLNPEANVTGVVFDPTSKGSTVYLSDLFSGVFRSLDGGLHWTAVNRGLLSRSVMQIAISGDGQHLYAGTEGSGAYRLDLNGQAPAAAAGLPPWQAQPTATAYQYQAATAAPGAPTPSAKGGGGLPFCGSALLPLGLIAAGLWMRGQRGLRSP